MGAVICIVGEGVNFIYFVFVQVQNLTKLKKNIDWRQVSHLSGTHETPDVVSWLTVKQYVILLCSHIKVSLLSCVNHCWSCEWVIEG